MQLLPKVLDIAAPPIRPSIQKRSVLLPKINLLAPLIPNPSQELFTGTEERRYFDVFASKTAFEILPSFDSGTLRQILLQACVSEAAIRHAVVALGALDKTAESFEAFGTSAVSLIERRRQDAVLHHRNALQQYATAIQYMREAASRRLDLRTTLLACLVIFCFEAWDGLKGNAVQQIMTGLELIRNWREEQVDELRVLDSPSRPPEAIEDDLIRAFSRLDMQAISFAPEGGSEERHTLAWTQEGAILNRMPSAFSSVQESEIYENAIMRRAMRFLSFKIPLPKIPRPFIMFPVNGWYGVRIESVVAIQQSILSDFSTWESAFDPLWRRLKAKKDSSLIIAAMLRLQVKTCCLALHQVCMELEEAWDDFQPLFTEIVELSAYTLNTLDVAKSSGPRFQFDSYVVIPLNMVAHKCREPRLRRRAISLLLSNARREGVWDSTAAGSCAAFAMEVEEKHLVRGKVPGWARIHGVVLETTKQPRYAKFSCEQRLGPLSEDLFTHRKAVNW